MSKNYAVARVVQYTQAGIGKAERHIERKNQSYENMNVDLSQTPQNVHFKRCEDSPRQPCNGQDRALWRLRCRLHQW